MFLRFVGRADRPACPGTVMPASLASVPRFSGA